MNLASMVDEIGRAVSASVQRATAPISRQIDELMAWKSAVGELRNGKDGAPGVPGKDGADGINGKDGEPGHRGSDGKEGAPGRDAPPIDLDAVVAKVLPLIPQPKDGRDGRDGSDGAKGLDGASGRDGERGSDGRDGKDGASIKRFDYDEKANTLDIVMDGGEMFTLRMPTPQRGEKGEHGFPGKDGISGRDGTDGAKGIDGKDGANGINGKDGASGLDGKDGTPGLRGEKGDMPSAEDVAAAITKACDALLPTMVSKHMESLMPEIITRASLLVPAGRDGLPGRPGTPGEAGRDGVDVKEFDITTLGDRKHQILVLLSDGTTFRKELEFSGMVLDRDVYRTGDAYEKGDAVTYGGSYWIAKNDTTGTPGKSDDWRLAVKRGRDGKDAE